MISFTEINHASEILGVPPDTIEKDYVICWLLACLAKCPLAKELVFYGGTAIKRVYFEDHRFSEDIDFTSSAKFTRDEIFKSLSSSFDLAKEKVNLNFEIDPTRIIAEGNRMQVFVRYSGLDEIVGTPKEVRVDLATEMESFGEVKPGKLLQTYSDLKGSSIRLPVFTLNTILAAKLGLLMSASRKEPRDLYDVWFLLSRLDRIGFNPAKVSRYFKEKYGFQPMLSMLKPHLHSPLFKERWERRLNKQIANLPPIASVVSSVENKLKKFLPQH